MLPRFGPVLVLLLALAPACAAPARASTASDLESIQRLEAGKRWGEADSVCVALIARLEAAPRLDSLSLAAALYEFSTIRYARNANSDSVTFRAASRSLAMRERLLPPDDDLIAQSRLVLARWLVDVGRTDSAIVQLRHIIDSRASRAIAGDTLVSEAWRGIGFARRDHSDWEGAIEAYRTSIQCREPVRGRDRVVGAMLTEIGRCEFLCGRIDEARDTLWSALAVIERTRGHDALAASAVYDYFSALERRAGNLALAIDYEQEAIRVTRLHLPDTDHEAVRLRRNMSGCLGQLGDWPGAIAMLRTVLPSYRSTYGDQHWRTVSVVLSLGIAKAGAGDSTAMSELRQAQAFFETRPGPPDPSLVTSLHYQAELLYGLGHPAEARPICEHALELARQRSPPDRIAQGELLILRAETLAELGDTTALAGAREELLRFAREEDLGASSAAPMVPYANALALRALGRPDEAWLEALEAERVARELLRQIARSQPDESGLTSTTRFATHLDLVFDMARAGDRSRFETAWDRLVRNRGLVRAEVERRRMPGRWRDDPEIALAHADWLAAQRASARAIVSDEAGRDSASRATIDRLRAEAGDAERIYARALEKHDSALPSDVPGLADVRARLVAGTALVSIVETEAASDSARVLALVARAGEPRFVSVELGRSSAIRAALAPWLERLATSPGSAAGRRSDAEEACRRFGEGARAITWNRIAPALAGISDVYLVPDGPLLDLDWQALPAPHGHYLVEAGPLIHILHAERELVVPHAAAQTPSLLVIGSPDFEHGDSAATSSPIAGVLRSAPDPCAGGAPRFAAIPATLDEANDVAAEWRSAGARVLELVGAEATEAGFKREAPGRTILHVATHGIVLRDTCSATTEPTRGVGGVAPVDPVASPSSARPANPSATPAAAPHIVSPWVGRRVWLALAGAGSPPSEASDEDDGRLTAEEVVTLDLSGVEWVVLSACHSGLGEGWSREGALGMRRAFHLAGARTVIASQWAVEDQSTRAWMSELHRARASGAPSAAQATAAASRAILEARRKSGRTTHPFYWAAFTASGE